MKTILACIFSLVSLMGAAQTPSIPQVPAMASYHAGLAALDSALGASDTNAVLAACLDLVDENRDLRDALLNLAERLPAFGATNVYTNLSSSAANEEVDSLVYDLYTANRTRSELLFAALEWQSSTNSGLYTMATNALEEARAEDLDLAPRVATAISNLTTMVAGPWLAGEIESEPEALSGDLLGVRVVVRNVGGAPALAVNLGFDTTSNLGLDAISIRLGDIPAGGRKSHLFLIDVPSGFDNATFRARASSASTSPLFLLRTLLISPP